MKKIMDYIFIISGCILAGFGTSCFLLPNQLSSGGFSGVATIIYYFYKINMGTIIIILNIPFFIIGYFKLGKNFTIKTVFGTFFYSIFIDMFNNIGPLVTDKFLSSIYGGIFIGTGLAFVFKANASTGGSDLIAHIAQNYNNEVKIGNVLVVFDIIIIILNLISFKKIEIGLYSAISIYIIGKMIDIVFEGINFCKIVYIISDKYEEIQNCINLEIKKGATGLYGKGSYTKKDRLIIMCVAKRRNVEKIKAFAKKIDPNAFIIISDAREVYGLGFK